MESGASVIGTTTTTTTGVITSFVIHFKLFWLLVPRAALIDDLFQIKRIVVTLTAIYSKVKALLPNWRSYLKLDKTNILL